MSINRSERTGLPQVLYGDTRITVDPNDASILIACLAVAANPANPNTTLHEACERVGDFALEREALFVGQKEENSGLSNLRKEPCR